MYDLRENIFNASITLYIVDLEGREILIPVIPLFPKLKNNFKELFLLSYVEFVVVLFLQASIHRIVQDLLYKIW
jgi:hypothetical protein